MNNYKFRKATLNDVDETLNLYNELIDELDKKINYPKWTRDMYPDYSYIEDKTKNQELFLLLEDNQIIGSTILNTDRIDDYKKVSWPMKDLKEDEVLTIHTFAIKNNLRGQNIGKVFLDYIEAFAKDNGFKAIRLDTINGNTPAVHFYERAGFSNLGEYELHYDETDETRFVLFEKGLIDG